MRVDLSQRTAKFSGGAPTEIEVEVLNTSGTIDGISARLVGLDPSWVVSEPQQLALFPDTSGVIRLRIQLPPEFPAGAHEIGIEVASSVTTDMAYDSIQLIVAPTTHAELMITPPLVSGRRKASTRVIADNTGNTPVSIRLSGADPERAVRFSFIPDILDVPAGTAMSAALDLVGKRRWFGSELRRNLDVVGEMDDDTQLDARGVFAQRAMIPRGVLTALILGSIVALWALAFLLGATSIFKKDALAKTAPASFFAATPSPTGGPNAAAPVGALAHDGGGSADIGGSVTGKVTAASNQLGVGRITVQAIRESKKRGPTLVSSAATDDDGVYTLLGLLPGKYKLHFLSVGFVDTWFPAASDISGAVPVSVATVDATKGINAVITGLPGSIAGKVDAGFTTTPVPVTVTAKPIVTAAGAPAGGVAPPTATPTQPPVTANVDPATNSFTLPGLATPGTYELSFLAPGYQATTVVQQLIGGQNLVTNTIRLSASDGSITGVVTDGSAPLGGVVVSAIAGGKTITSATPTAGAVGHFTLSGLPSPGTYLVAFVKEGFGAETIAIDLGPGENRANVTVTLTGGTGSISGMAHVAGGEGLGDADVIVSGGTTTVTSKTLTAGLVGGFVVSGVPTPGTYTVTFAKAGYETQTVPVTLGSSGLARNVDATLPRVFASLSGLITDTPTNGGAGIANATVNVTDGNLTREAKSATLPTAGTYTLTDLAPKTYSVTVSADGYVAKTTLITIGPGENATLDVELKKPGDP